MNSDELRYELQKIEVQLCDMEWRIFKEWQRVMPDESFFAYKKNSILKRAAKENIKKNNVL